MSSTASCDRAAALFLEADAVPLSECVLYKRKCCLFPPENTSRICCFTTSSNSCMPCKRHSISHSERGAAHLNRAEKSGGLEAPGPKAADVKFGFGAAVDAAVAGIRPNLLLSASAKTTCSCRFRTCIKLITCKDQRNDTCSVLLYLYQPRESLYSGLGL